MRRKSLLALLLVLSMALSGCALVVKDEAVDAATEIIRLGDQVVTKGEIQQQVNYQLVQMYNLYQQYGLSYDVTDSSNVETIQQYVIENYENELVSHQKISELGLDNLTEEEEAHIQADAESIYSSYLEDYIASYMSDSELTGDELTAQAQEELTKLGYTMEEAQEEAREDFLSEKLRAEVIKDVTVTDEEIRSEYDTRVATAQSSYEGNAAAYTTSFNNGTSPLYWAPEGVRLIKQILIQYSDDQSAAITDAQGDVAAAQAILDSETATEEEKATAQVDLEAAQAVLDTVTDAAFASIDEEADAVLADLEAGADWETEMAAKTEDPGMQSGTTAERGYAVSADMTSFDPAFVEAAMALANVGDISGKVRGSAYGYYILKYVGDVTSGAIDYDSVKDTISASLLSTKQSTYYSETVQSWMDAADFKVDTASLNN